MSDLRVIKRLSKLVLAKWPNEPERTEWWTKFTAARRRKLRILFDKQKSRCFYCNETCLLPEKNDSKISDANRKRATLEHLKPQIEGGFDNFSNLKMACYECNNSKQSRDLEDFIKDRAKPDWKARAIKNKEDRRMARWNRRILATRIIIINLGIIFWYREDIKLAVDKILEEFDV